ncbi:MAG: biotin transporter BioY [Ruthenibacterium sp.]
MMTQTKTRSLVLAALLAAVTAVLAQISLPIGPVPFTLAVLGAFLTGLLLPPSYAMASIGVYIVLGAIGMPVFAGFSGGPAALVGPTGGYLVGYFLLALLPSVAVQKGASTIGNIVAALLGLLGCYILGTAWFIFLTGNGLIASLGWCVMPFVLPDIAKAVVAVLLAKALRKRIRAVL